MLVMENAEEVLQILERFTKLKQKDIPKELEDYLSYVAKTGDTVYTWSNVKYLFREKLMHVIKDFHDTTSSVDDLPQYPNVDPFNYETMKSALLERLELFSAAPFTVQRLCELLTDPKKQYSRIDKYMRALEKNILVVSTIEPGRKQPESENGDSLDSVVNGDLSLDVNIDVEIDMANEAFFGIQQQQIRNNATSSATKIVTNKSAAPATTTGSGNSEDNVIDDDVVMPNAKKLKLDLETNVSTINIAAASATITTTTAATTTTVTTTETKTSIPITQSSEIPKDQQKTDTENTDSSDDSDSQESKEETNKIVKEQSDEIKSEDCADPSAINVKDNENEESKILIKDKLTKDKENLEIAKTDLENANTASTTTTTALTMQQTKLEEKNETKNETLTTSNDDEISKAEDKLLNVDDDLDCGKLLSDETDKKSEIDIDEKLKIESNDEVTKDADELIKDVETTLKESAEADDNVEKEIDKIEQEESENKSLEITTSTTDNENKIETFAEIEDEKLPISSSSLEEPIKENFLDTKIAEKMSVEDVTISAVAAATNVVETNSVSNIISEAINEASVLTPESISPADVDVAPVVTTTLETQHDQPMEDSVVAMATCTANEIECTTAGDVIGNIDEVVMQSNEMEMATDTDPQSKLTDKPDLSGMDVDDTSQEEAMDQ